MDYTLIDNPAEVAAQSLRSSALQKDELAYQAEFLVDELKSQPINNDESVNRVKAAEEDAQRLRREADAYIKASDLGKDEITNGRVSFLKRLMQQQQQSHIVHTAQLRVRADLGEPTADYDSILTLLDNGHKIAAQKVVELTRAKPTKKAAK